MPESDGAAIRVDVLSVIRQSQLAEHCKSLRRECLIQLDDIHLPHIEPCPAQRLATGRHRTDAHDTWLNTCCSGRDDARAWSQAEPFGRLLRGDDQRTSS